MKRGPTGRHQIVRVGGEKVEAFVPLPLPPDPPIAFDSGRQRLLERATLALGRLDGISPTLPDLDLFLYAYVRREALLSSQIEGTQSTLDQLLLFELDEAPGVPLDDVKEVSNYVEALDHGLRRLKEGFPLSNRLIREMHRILLRSGRGSGKAPGDFRTGQNWIGGTRLATADFVPPPADRVQECMAALERFLHDRRDPYLGLVKAALAHVQFETIHPFLDGNGRIGRLLVTFVLQHEGLIDRPLLYLSLYFKQNRTEYYRLLNIVRTEGDWEAWLDFFLEGVELTANNAVETAQRLLVLFREDAQRIQQAGRGASSAFRVFDALRGRPLLTIRRVCDRTGLSFPAAAKAMETLCELGIAREVTGRRRNRIFAYDECLAVLREGAEPL